MPNTAPDTAALPLIDVCVCTYRRPEQLRRMLLGVLAQETGGRFRFAVHVADNDAGRSGEAVVRELAAAGHPLTYAVEPVQNISLARNLSLREASGQWIATADDDDVPDARWLLNLFETAVALDADVVHGSMSFRFPAATPGWIAPFHAFPAPPTGSTRGYVYATCNALFRRSLVEGNDAPFDRRFGRTGGGDTAFFNGLAARGCRMVFCREAVVRSDVQPERARLGWIVRRRFRHGVTAAALGRPLGARAIARTVRDLAVLTAVCAAYTACGLYLPCGHVHPKARGRAAVRAVAVLLELAYLAGRIAHAVRFDYEEYAAAAR